MSIVGLATFRQASRMLSCFFPCNAISYLALPQVLEREFYGLAQEVAGWTEAESKTRMCSIFERAKLAFAGKKIEWNGQEISPRYHFKDETIIEWLTITKGRDHGHMLPKGMSEW